jgi:hypothetical protein
VTRIGVASAGMLGSCSSESHFMQVLRVPKNLAKVSTGACTLAAVSGSRRQALSSSVPVKALQSHSGAVGQAILVEFLVKPHAADAQLGGGSQAVVVVFEQGFLDAQDFGGLLALRQRRTRQGWNG